MGVIVANAIQFFDADFEKPPKKIKSSKKHC
jgi:hypothetical protein